MTSPIGPHLIVLGMLTIEILGTGPARAVTYLWDGGGADNSWSSTTNWNPDTSSPTSASNTVVQLDGDLRTTSLQDLSSPFVLNKLDFKGSWSTFTLSGAPLRFVADGTTPPRITHSRTSSVVINTAIDIPTGTTLDLQLDTQDTTFNGVISGGGSIDRLLAWNGTLNLNNGDNSFSGGLTVRSQNKEYYIVKVNASNAMGAGPVNLYGGALGTNIAFVGGLMFHNTTAHTNAIRLFQDSVIGAGDPTTAGFVSLSGPVDLNTNTLYLRGCGTGALNGSLLGGAPEAIRKIDKGTWILSGANAFTGRVTIADGTLKVSAAAALNPAVPVTIAGGTYNLGGLSVAHSTVTFSTGRMINGTVQATAYTATESGTVLATMEGTAGLTKSGDGTLTLYGPHAFSGPIAVDGGTVAVQPYAPAPNSTLWLDASAPLSLAKNRNGSGGTPAAGDTVGRWTSLSGNNWAIDKDGIPKPTYQTNVVNGLPALRFATGCGLYLDSLVAAQGSTVFLVFLDRGPTNDWRNVLSSEGQTPNQGWLHALDNVGNRSLIKGGGAVYISSPESATNWAVQTMQMQMGNYRLWVNENGYGPSTSSTNFTPFTRLGDTKLAADIAEMLVYTNILSAADRVTTIRYLRRKWLGESGVLAATNNLSTQIVAAVKAGTALDLSGNAQTMASLCGSGTVTADTVTVTGTLAPGDTNTVAGALTVNGNLTLAAGITNAVDYVAATSDVVNVAGTLSVLGAGTVVLSLDGQTPPQQMTLFTFGSLSGKDNLAVWSVKSAALKSYTARVKAVGNSVVLEMFPGGTLISVR